MEQSQINTFDELIDFLRANDLTPEQVNEIIRLSLKCFYLDNLTKDEMIDGLIIHWDKYGHQADRSPFIGFNDPLDIDVI